MPGGALPLPAAAARDRESDATPTGTGTGTGTGNGGSIFGAYWPRRQPESGRNEGVRRDEEQRVHLLGSWSDGEGDDGLDDDKGPYLDVDPSGTESETRHHHLGLGHDEDVPDLFGLDHGDGMGHDVEAFSHSHPLPRHRHWTSPARRSPTRYWARLSSCTRYIPAKIRNMSRRRLLVLATLLIVGILMARSYFKEAALRRPWVPDSATEHFGQKILKPPRERSRIEDYKLPLRTSGRHIVDADGRRFKLATVNWYGASDELFVPGGLEVRHRDALARTVKRLGFNSVRLPYADELVMENPVVAADQLTANPDLVGKRALDIFWAVVEALTSANVTVIVNNHITSATWCCGADPCDAGWANDHLPRIACRVRQTEDEWIEHWETVMRPLAGNPLVIGADLRNEVRGLWGTMPWAKWARAAERCGNRLLAVNPDWLVVVEGTESANDLSRARERPVALDVAQRLVYSAHVYGWSGWGSREGRFKQRRYDSFARTMRHNWGYLLENGTRAGDAAVPVWVGELGAPRGPSLGDVNYWQHLTRYLREVDADFGYWALNPRKASGNETEGYALLENDWKTPVLDYRMKDLVDLMSPQAQAVDDEDGGWV